MAIARGGPTRSRSESVALVKEYSKSNAYSVDDDKYLTDAGQFRYYGHGSIPGRVGVASEGYGSIPGRVGVASEGYG